MGDSRGIDVAHEGRAHIEVVPAELGRVEGIVPERVDADRRAHAFTAGTNHVRGNVGEVKRMDEELLAPASKDGSSASAGEVIIADEDARKHKGQLYARVAGHNPGKAEARVAHGAGYAGVDRIHGRRWERRE